MNGQLLWLRDVTRGPDSIIMSLRQVMRVMVELYLYYQSSLELQVASGLSTLNVQCAAEVMVRW